MKNGHETEVVGGKGGNEKKIASQKSATMAGAVLAPYKPIRGRKN